MNCVWLSIEMSLFKGYSILFQCICHATLLCMVISTLLMVRWYSSRGGINQQLVVGVR